MTAHGLTSGVSWYALTATTGSDGISDTGAPKQWTLNPYLWTCPALVDTSALCHFMRFSHCAYRHSYLQVRSATPSEVSAHCSGKDVRSPTSLVPGGIELVARRPRTSSICEVFNEPEPFCPRRPRLSIFEGPPLGIPPPVSFQRAPAVPIILRRVDSPSLNAPGQFHVTWRTSTNVLSGMSKSDPQIVVKSDAVHFD